MPPREQDQDAAHQRRQQCCPLASWGSSHAERQGSKGQERKVLVEGLKKEKPKSPSIADHVIVYMTNEESVCKLLARIKFSKVAGLKSNSRINYLNYVPETKKMKNILIL